MDDEQRYQAAASKDARFDGVFFTAVRTTGIYCRPSCPAITPKRANVTLLPDGGRGAAGRVPRLQAVPAGRLARLPRVERPVGRRRARHAADRGRRRGPGRGARARGAPRLLAAPGRAGADRRGRRGAAGAGPGAAGADRPDSGRDDHAADGRHRVRGRVHLHPPVQRDDARGVRHAAERAAGTGRAPARTGANGRERRGRAGRARCACGCRSGRRSTWRGSSGTSRRGPCRGSRWSPRPSTAGRSAFRTDPGWPGCGSFPARTGWSARSRWPTCATSPPPCSAAGACSTWTRTRWRSPATWRPIR